MWYFTYYSIIYLCQVLGKKRHILYHNKSLSNSVFRYYYEEDTYSIINTIKKSYEQNTKIDRQIIWLYPKITSRYRKKKVTTKIFYVPKCLGVRCIRSGESCKYYFLRRQQEILLPIAFRLYLYTFLMPGNFEFTHLDICLGKLAVDNRVIWILRH